MSKHRRVSMMSKCRHYILASAAVALLLSSAAASSLEPAPLPSADVRRQIDVDVRDVLRRWEVPGALIAVIQEGRVVYTQAYGLRDRERKLAVTVDTPFEIGSITKQFTAAAILQLQEAGKIELDSAVATYLPDAPHAREITVRQLLSHTSGLPDYFSGPDIFEAAAKPVTFAQLMDTVRDKPLDFAPGEKWAYSNTGYILLGRIVEVVSQQTYRDYVRSRFFDRLGMTDTHTMADEGHLPGMAVGYRHIDGKLQRAPAIHDSFAWSAGNIVSTIGDLNKWKAALRSGGVVTQAHYALMATSVQTRQGDAGYGLGLFVDQAAGQPRVGHTGGAFGFTTAEEYFPRQRVQIIAFTNSGDDTPEPGEVLTQAIFDDLYPDIAAAAVLPSGDVDAKTLSTAKATFASLQSGTYDYAHFADGLAAKLKGGLAARWVKLFSGYGPPTHFVFKGSRGSSGRHWSDYLIKFGPGCYLKLGLAVDDEGRVASLSFG